MECCSAAGRPDGHRPVLVAAIAGAAVDAVLVGGVAVRLEVGEALRQAAQVTGRQGALLLDVTPVRS